MAGTWDTLDRYVVISSDSHAGADLRDYKAYLPSRWHDEFDAWADSYSSPYDDLIHATAHRNWDSDFRLSELDADGIAGEILIPNTVPPFFPTTMLIVIGLPKTRDEFEHRWAGAQAHNRWVADFVAQSPARRRGLVQIFPNDVDEALREIRWAKETGAFGGILLVPVPPGHPVEPFFHRRYEPLWSLCEEVGFPIALHNGTAPDMPMDEPASKTLVLLHAKFSNDALMMDMLVAGVFERHPDLKIVPTESGPGPAYDIAKGLDMMVRPMRSDAKNRTMGMFGGDHLDSLSMLPSEYVRRNFYFACSGPVALPVIFDMRYEIGVDHLMWGADYPHEEGTTPQSLLALRWAFADVPEAEVRQMVGGNMARLYGFDLEALVPVAERIGPLVAEVHRPLTPEDLAPTEDANIREFVDRPFPGGALLTRSRPADTRF